MQQQEEWNYWTGVGSSNDHLRIAVNHGASTQARGTNDAISEEEENRTAPKRKAEKDLRMQPNDDEDEEGIGARSPAPGHAVQRKQAHDEVMCARAPAPEQEAQADDNPSTREGDRSAPSSVLESDRTAPENVCEGDRTAPSSVAEGGRTDNVAKEAKILRGGGTSSTKMKVRSWPLKPPMLRRRMELADLTS